MILHDEYVIEIYLEEGKQWVGYAITDTKWWGRDLEKFSTLDPKATFRVVRKTKQVISVKCPEINLLHKIV